jgi:hypothetical protein
LVFLSIWENGWIVPVGMSHRFVSTAGWIVRLIKSQLLVSTSFAVIQSFNAVSSEYITALLKQIVHKSVQLFSFHLFV